jgi:pimeloyl-ACP methyl ester carboxylesterase
MPNTHLLIGSGALKVIALHGWFGHAHGWGPFTQHLNGRDFGYAFMDQRGYGGMRGSGGPYTMEQIAQDALALADHLGWRRFSLIGHSMGGSAIQQVLAAAPERVRALVGVTPVSAAGVPFDEQGWGLFTAAGHDAQARRTIIDFTTGSRLTGTWLDAMVASTQKHSDDEAVAGYLTSWAKTAFVEKSRASACPCWCCPASTTPPWARPPAAPPGCSTTPTRSCRCWPTPGTTRWTRRPSSWRRGSSSFLPACLRESTVLWPLTAARSCPPFRR